MARHDSGKTASNSDTRAGGNRMGDHETWHQQRPEDRADEIVKRLQRERGEE